VRTACGGDARELAAGGSRLSPLERGQEQAAAEPVPRAAVLVRELLAQDRMAEEPRRVRGQEDPRHRRHPVTPLSSERDPHHAPHARLVAEAGQKGHRVAPHPEPVVVLRGAARTRPGDDRVHAIEAAVRLPQVALDGAATSRARSSHRRPPPTSPIARCSPARSRAARTYSALAYREVTTGVLASR
jgi:hypothetical protein